MEPRQPEQLIRAHEASQPPQQYETGSGVGVPERLIQDAEKGLDARAVQAEAAQVAMPSAPTLPPALIAQPAITQGSSSDDTATLLASDDDLIEKEWVDKAKKIIAETKDDPYKREYEISKLQIEYIRKRYGREIGQAED